MRDTKWAMSLADTLRGAESLTFPSIVAITLADKVKSLQSALSEATARAERAEDDARNWRRQHAVVADKLLGTPCAEIRWQQEKEVLVEELERAEAELKAAREQEPIGWMHDKEGRVDMIHKDVKALWQKVGKHQNTMFMRELVPCRVEHYNIPLYARPIPAPAAQVPQNATCKHPLQVPSEWREVLSGLVAIAEKKGKKQGSPNHCHQRPGIWDDDNGPALSGKPCAECAMYDKARALIQQSEVKP